MDQKNSVDSEIKGVSGSYCLTFICSGGSKLFQLTEVIDDIGDFKICIIVFLSVKLVAKK